MYLFIIPLVVMLASQVIKIGAEYSRGTFAWSHIMSYGGMPSSHAALATSLATCIAYFEGVSSSAFAVSIILLVVILRDAMGFRHQLGIHGKILNQLVEELPKRVEYKFPILSERMGHTIPEVLAGIVVGLIGTCVLIAWFVS